jgi:uncharacterized metal-binding protein YceD (DUF177 family)
MKNKNVCILKFSGLKEGTHDFQYKIDKKLFENYESSEIHDADVDINVNLIKRKNMLELNFDINGKINVSCDRCLGDFDIEISYQTELIVEFGEENSDLSDADNSITIAQSEHELILDKHIFDYLNICVPYRKVHPKDENGNSTCDIEMIKKLEELETKDIDQEETDSRWDKLKELYN